MPITNECSVLNSFGLVNFLTPPDNNEEAIKIHTIFHNKRVRITGFNSENRKVIISIADENNPANHHETEVFIWDLILDKNNQDKK